MNAIRKLRAECRMDIPPLRRRAVATRLRRALKNRCEHAFLFGSLARDEHMVHSDIDLCIVADTRAPFAERFHDYLDIVQAFAPMDLVVLTPGEYRAVQTKADVFWRHVMKHRFRVI